MQTRRGFTLLELLIVIAIIGILIALLVPAVQQVRASAAKVPCANNLRQIGMALYQYHEVHKVFPPGMSWNRGKGPLLMSSWLTHLLPFVEQQNLWEKTQAAFQQSPSPFKNPPHAGLATVIPVYGCPADGRAGMALIAPVDKFPVAFTSYLGVSGKDLESLDGIFFRDSRIRLGDIDDGLSQTLLAGERPPSADLQFGWWYAGAGQRFTGSADMLMGVYEKNALPITKGSCPPGSYPFGPGRLGNQCDMFHFWSLHPGGAHFLYADGSVHFLTYSAAPLLPALASRAGGEVVTAPD